MENKFWWEEISEITNKQLPSSEVVSEKSKMVEILINSGKRIFRE